MEVAGEEDFFPTPNGGARRAKPPRPNNLVLPVKFGSCRRLSTLRTGVTDRPCTREDDMIVFRFASGPHSPEPMGSTSSGLKFGVWPYLLDAGRATELLLQSLNGPPEKASSGPSSIERAASHHSRSLAEPTNWPTYNAEVLQRESGVAAAELAAVARDRAKWRR